MDDRYDVYLHDKVIGHVSVTCHGLYCAISCSCELPDNRMYRLYGRTKSGEICFGLLYPQDNAFCLNTKIPEKRMSQGLLRFFAAPKDEDEACIKLDSAKQFPSLIQLEKFRFLILDGQPSLKIVHEKNG